MNPGEAAARVRAAMCARGVTAEALAKQLGVHASTLGRWLRGSQPRNSAKLTQALKLLGETPDKTSAVPLDQLDAARMRAMMGAHDLSVAAMADQLGVHRITLSRWLSGRTRLPPEQVARAMTLLGETPRRFKARVRAGTNDSQ